MAPSPVLSPAPQSPDVYRAIAYVMKEIGKAGISKDRKNQQQGYSFRGIDEVMNALNPILSDAALVILPRMMSRTQEERTTAKGGLLFYVVVEAQFDFVSAKDGTKHTAVMYGEAMDSADKATNKAMSAALKYACLQVFCIPTEGMDDADAVTHTPEPKQQSAPQQAAPHSEPSYRGDIPEELRAPFANIDKDRNHVTKVIQMVLDVCESIGPEAVDAYNRIYDKFEGDLGNRKATVQDYKALILKMWASAMEEKSKIGATA